MGGAGSAVLEVLSAAGVQIPVLQLGLPDEFIDHGEQSALLAGVGLTLPASSSRSAPGFPACWAEAGGVVRPAGTVCSGPANL